MPEWITIAMLTPIALWLLVYGVLFFLSDGEALVAGIGAGPSFAFAFPLFGLWLLLDGLIYSIVQEIVAGLLVLTSMGLLLAAIYLFRRFGREKRD